MIYGVSTTSLWRQQSQLGAPGQTWPVGSIGQWLGVDSANDRWGRVNRHVSTVKADVAKSTLTGGAHCG